MDSLRAVIRDFLGERISAPVAVARLLFHVESPDRLRELLRAHRLAAEVAGRANASRIDELAELVRTHRSGIARVHELIQAHERALGSRPGVETVESWRRFFDDSVRTSEAGSVAAYSLGSPELLADGTAEIVSLFESSGFVGPSVSLLEIGCGIGRIAEALAPRVLRYHGTDIAPAMLHAARLRCGALPNAAFSLASGRDVSGFESSSFDVVAAVDSFPYIHHAGPALVDVHFAESRRVLRAGGSLVLLNYSYGGDVPAERAEVAQLAAFHGFELAINGVRPFRLWDGALFLLKKR